MFDKYRSVRSSENTVKEKHWEDIERWDREKIFYYEYCWTEKKFLTSEETNFGTDKLSCDQIFQQVFVLFQNIVENVWLLFDCRASVESEHREASPKMSSWIEMLENHWQDDKQANKFLISMT